MKLSIIDIGTQSIKHYIFEQNREGRKLVHYKRNSGANLGESITLSQETIERNMQILQDCFDLNKKEKVEKTHLVGTEILRKASNASFFTDKVREIFGLDIEVISHEKEALYLYEGFLDVVNPGEKFGAINIGGGTTELVIGTKEKLLSSVKLPFGNKFLRKTFREHNNTKWRELDEYLEKEIKVTEQADDFFVTGVLDFMDTVRPQFPFISDPSNLPDHPFSLTIENWSDWILKMRTIPLEKIKEHYAKDPNFCDGMIIGQSVYYAFAKKLDAKKVFPSKRDLTDGIVYEMSNIRN